MGDRRLTMALLLSIMFVGSVPIEQVTGVIADLRALAVKVGCPEAQVRTAVKWAGAGRPAVIEVDCPGPARAPAAAPVPAGLIEEPAP